MSSAKSAPPRAGAHAIDRSKPPLYTVGEKKEIFSPQYDFLAPSLFDHDPAFRFRGVSFRRHE